MELQVFSNWTNANNPSGYAADRVIIYGTMQNGKPVQDNTIRVYGTRNKNNAIVAEAIESTTDGTRTEFDPPPIPATVVKVITFVALFILLILIWLISSGLRGVGAGIDMNSVGRGIVNMVINGLLALIAVRVTIYCGARAFRMAFRGGDITQTVLYGVGAMIGIVLLKTFITSMF